MKKTVLLFLLLGFTTGFAFADANLSNGKTTYYIDPVKGSDNNPGTALNRPWKTFTRLNKLTLMPGTKVQVNPGDFHTSMVLHARGNSKSPVNVTFTRGRYNFFPDGAYKTKLHITNTNDVPDSLKAIALYIANSKFVNITGSGARIVLRGKMIETYIDKSENVSITGLSYDYYRPTVSELEVGNVTDNYADLKITPSSKYSIADSTLWWEGEGWRHKQGWYWQALNKQTNELSRIDLNLDKVKFTNLGNNTIRAHFAVNPGFKTGITYQTRDVLRDCAGIFMQYSKNIRIQNIRIYFMHGMGVVSQFCENIKMDRIVVKPEEGTGKTCAAWADILHFSGCSGKIEVANSYLSAANDDAINVHGTHLRIIDKPAENQIKVHFMHGQTYGFAAFFAGDSIGFTRSSTLNSYGSNVVLKAERLNDKDILLTLKNPSPVNIEPIDVIENITRTPRVWVHNTTITRIPTRGILVTTRRKVLIENNQFIKTHMSAVLMEDDAESWYESGAVKNVVIRNNSFVQCGGPVISIHPENKLFDKPVHQNLSVVNNSFDLKTGSKLLAAKSATNITVSGNKTNATTSLKSLTDFKDCSNVILQ